MSTNKSIRKSISLYPKDWKYVELFREQLNMGRSTSIRFIINDHKRLKDTYEPSNSSEHS
jgi:hypothetical protein